MSKKIDITDQKFSRLLFLREEGRNKHSQIMCRCVCDCGKEVIIVKGSLTSGNTTNCGCIRRQKTIKRNKADKGRIPWNKGKTGIYSEKTIKKMSEAQSGKNNNNYSHGLTATKGYANAKTQKRKAIKLKQTPALTKIEKNRILFINEVAGTMKDCHVDHIKPLNKNGLHHPDNLQILEAKLNLEKYNKWPLTEKEQIKYKGYRL